jgi:hypothetical protein
LYTDVVDIQLRADGDAVTINAGVLSHTSYEKYADEKPPAFVDEAICTVRARVGQLIDGKDLWWSLDDPQTDNNILLKLTKYVLPFLTNMHSLNAMAEFLKESARSGSKYPPPLIYLAIINSELGNIAEACTSISDLRKTAPKAWQRKLYRIGTRIGCY